MDVFNENTMCSEEITELAKAMLQVQQALKPASKDQYNVFTKSKYATLASVMEACRDALLTAGIWVTQYPVDLKDPALLGLVTKLIHAESGQWQASLLTLPLSKLDPQGYGSALTYARRYGLSALVGIVTEDDDGHLASNSGTSTSVQVRQKLTRNESGKPSISGSKGSNPPTVSNDLNSASALLPHIDGVKFHRVDTAEGHFVTASGDTRNKKSLLKAAGFSWDADQKTWWKAV